MNPRHVAWPSLALASTLMLSACGGGHGGDHAPTQVPAGSTLTLSGVVSVGPAVANAPVQITCATGAATATTAADGSYSAGVASGALPCVLRANTSSGGLLHSVATSTTAAVKANITPLTELVTASVTYGNPDTLFTSFDASAQAKVTPVAVATAVSATAAALAGNVDLTGANPLTDTLVATTAGAAGNTSNQLIVQLNSAITAAQTTLEAVTAAVAAATPATAPVLPQLAARATSCTGLRSGSYRSLDPHETSDDPASEALQLHIDAQALTATSIGPGGDGSVTALRAVAGAPCSFTFKSDSGTDSTALVSPGGLIVVRSTSSTGPIRTSFVVPDQTVPLAQLAGTWNYVSYQRPHNMPTAPLLPANGTALLDAAGRFASGTVCAGLTCRAATASDLPDAMTVDTTGGFDMRDGPGLDRAFALIADNGAKTLFILFPGEGGILVLTQQQALALPAVDAVIRYWDFNVGSGAFEFAPVNDAEGGASTLQDYSVTVTAADTAAQRYTRLRANDQRVDTFLNNNPRNGVRNRVASASAPGAFSMPLAGWGLTLSTNVDDALNYLDVSVEHP